MRFGKYHVRAISDTKLETQLLLLVFSGHPEYGGQI